MMDEEIWNVTRKKGRYFKAVVESLDWDVKIVFEVCNSLSKYS
jgi:hypothetical protein